VNNQSDISIDDIRDLCGQYPSVTSDYPFGPQPECYRVGGKIFAEIYPRGVPGALRILLKDDSIPKDEIVPMITLRCEPIQGDFYRTLYPGTILRPYHCPPAQQPYANTILLNSAIGFEAVKGMIEHAYTVILHKLPKKTQAEILSK